MGQSVESMAFNLKVMDWNPSRAITAGSAPDLLDLFRTQNVGSPYPAKA